jgi:DNA polymerase III gamma/tau subunit
MDYSKITLGELLSSENETIKRNAVSILKVLQNNPKKITIDEVQNIILTLHQSDIYKIAEWINSASF